MRNTVSSVMTLKRIENYVKRFKEVKNFYDKCQDQRVIKFSKGTIHIFDTYDRFFVSVSNEFLAEKLLLNSGCVEPELDIILELKDDSFWINS